MQAVINFIEANWEAFKQECRENKTDPDEVLEKLNAILNGEWGITFDE